MPELPEVEVVVRGLKQQILNCEITKVDVLSKGVRTRFPENFAKNLLNRKVIDVSRRAKYILCYLNMGGILLIHLGMSGRVIIQQKASYAFQKHNHLVVEFGNKVLIYNDYRRFGDIKVVKDFNPSNLGLEPLEENFNVKTFMALVKDKKTNIKSFLMNQKYVVGIGNIYACEALFLSKISPIKIASNITLNEAQVMVKNIKTVLQSAIGQGGSSLKDFINVNGESGKVQNNFWVYGRKGMPCKICKNEIKTTKQQGRSTFYCPNCQGF